MKRFLHATGVSLVTLFFCFGTVLTAQTVTGYNLVVNPVSDDAFTLPISDVEYVKLDEMQRVSISVMPDDPVKGFTTGGGEYYIGTTATISAEPNSFEYVFSSWSDGNTDNPRIVENVTDGMEFIANFVKADYLSLTSTLDSDDTKSTVSINRVDSYNSGWKSPNVEYSMDGVNWNPFDIGNKTIQLENGETVWFRGLNPQSFSKSEDEYIKFAMTGDIVASGSVMSLVDNIGIGTKIPNDYCFAHLFDGCMALSKAPALTADTLKAYCYASMFNGCSGLSSAPELQSLTMAEASYKEMFKECTALLKAPALPATTLANYCYSGIFNGCSSIVESPILAVSEFGSLVGCYQQMFNGCSSLSKITVAFDTWIDGNTTNWVAGVASSGTFVCPENLEPIGDANHIPESWLGKIVHPAYLCFTATEENSTIELISNGTGWSLPVFEYSTDKVTWSEFKYGESNKLTLENVSDKIYLRGNNSAGISNSDINYVSFAMTGGISASGSTMSLIDGYGFTDKIPNDYCFYKLFANCAAMSTPPALSAVEITPYCYFGMFDGCTNLINAPALPAFTMYDYCYANMFRGCQSLTAAPMLSSLKLAEGCYYGMFEGCKQITTAPSLKAENLEISCYENMFRYCESLNNMDVGFMTWNDENRYTVNWVEGVADDGVFHCIKGLDITKEGDNYIPFNWIPKVKVYPDYLTFTAMEPNSTIKLRKDKKTLAVDSNPEILYAFDRDATTWTKMTTSSKIILENIGDKVYFKGTNSNTFNVFVIGNLDHVWWQFVMTGKIAASGTLMSLVDSKGEATTIPDNKFFLIGNCSGFFRALFKDCTSLVSAPKLTATTLKIGCYEELFSGCSNLETAPELPATTLGESCYQYMFNKCTSLKKAPLLNVVKPSSALNCYKNMFVGCSNLNYINVSFESWSTFTNGWVSGVAPTGTFVCSAKLEPVTGVNRIPVGWIPDYRPYYTCFTAKEDNSTIAMETIGSGWNAPVLEYSKDQETWHQFKCNDGVQVTLSNGENVYFRGNNPQGISVRYDRYARFVMTGKIEASGSVMSLIDNIGASRTIPADYALAHLFEGCSALTKAPEVWAKNLKPSSYEYMFSKCSITKAPSLPATTMTTYCYYFMFNECTKLTSAPSLPATKLAQDCYAGMFAYCSSLVNAPALKSTSLVWACYEDMFKYCTSLKLIDVSFKTWDQSQLYNNRWVTGVPAGGTFKCPIELPEKYGNDYIPQGWTVQKPEPEPTE